MLRSLSGRAETVTQSRLLTVLRDQGRLSRPRLADAMGVSRTTVAAEVTRLVELGLAQDVGPSESRGGRRSTVVDLSHDIRFVGIAVGATRVSVGLTDGRIEVLARRELDCDVRQGPDRVLGIALDVAKELLADAGIDRPMGVGIGVPGPVDFDRGVPVSPPLMSGWDGYPVRDAVSRELGCPAVLDNDVNLLAVGERHAGVARAADDFLFVKIGTGIGCGIVIAGELFRGVDGCAGDIGHIRVDDDGPVCACGNRGCLEAYSSGAALARKATRMARDGGSPALAGRLAEKGELRAEDLGWAIGQGDPEALTLLRDSARRVGQVLATLVSFFNPGLIVIGGRVSALGHTLLAEIRGETYRRSLPLATGKLPIVLSELGDEGGVVGAARLVSATVFAPLGRN
ncbi:MAG: ROK family protein [Thermocrispum sp.]